MASAPQGLAQPVSAPQPAANIAAPTTDSPSSPSRPVLNPGPRALTPPVAKHLLSPQIELTGAAALAEREHQRKEDMARQTAPMTSPNPAQTSLLTGGASLQPMSRPSDAPHGLPTPGQSSSSSGGSAPSNPSAESNDHHAVGNGTLPTIDAPSLKPASEQLSHSMQPPAAQNLHPNYFASSRGPGQEISTPPSRRDSVEKQRKRPLSPASQETGPTYSSYPPLTPASDLAHSPARNQSLPNSSSRSGGRSPAAKKHRCPHCSTEFTRHHNLKSHLLTHSQEKPYGCEHCDARFRRLHDLKRHLKLHTGERPHVCEICGRAFARGDALARHNKGNGGCAGRRESGVDEDDLDGDGDVDMDGDGNGSGDDADPMQRRRSEPHKKSRRLSNRPSLGGGGRHGSTYPPVAPVAGASQAYYHHAGGSSNASSSGGRARGMSPPHHHQPSIASVPGFSNIHYGQHPAMYAQGGVTESPKPLSPGVPDHRGSDASMRGRSPSISTRMQQQMLRSNTNPGTPPVSLPPPHQQLPSMQTTDPRFLPSGGARLPPPSISTHAPPSGVHSGPSSAGPTSASSHPHSSGGSMRELYPQPTAAYNSHEPAPQVEDLMAYIRTLQEQNSEERAARAREREETARLRDEIGLLKAQIGGLRR